MIFPLIACLLATKLCFAQTPSTCQVVTPVQQHKITMTYYNRIPVQVPPVSTVYNQLVYRTAYAVNCELATMVMVDDNLPQVGQYTTRTTIDALTMDRVTCIQETGVITRRDVRGYPAEDVDLKRRTLETPAPHQNEKRAALKEAAFAIADAQAAEVPPDAQTLSVLAYKYIVEVNSALFALNLVQSGFNLNATCAALRDPVTMARLYTSSIDPVQTADIICYAAQFGLYFNVSTAQILSDLVGVIYSIEVKSGWTSDEKALCSYLESSLSTAGYLGLDVDGIHDFVCGPNITSSPSSNSFSTGFGTGFGSAGPTAGTGFTGSVTAPFANSTGVITNSIPAAGPTEIPPQRDNTTSAGLTGIDKTGTARGTAGPAASESFNIVYPNATGDSNNGLQNSGRVPPSPVSSLYYAAWTTSTTPAPRMPRY